MNLAIVDYPHAKYGALRIARKLALARYISLRRFVAKVSIFDESDTLGPEWHASSYRGSGYVVVWYPIGEENQIECRRSMEFIYERGPYIFGISIHE